MASLDKGGFDVCIVERTFSHRQEDVGKVTIGKVLKIPQLCFRLIKALILFRPTLAVFFITVGFGSFLVDCLLLSILRLFRVDYILYMHGRGLDRWGKVPVLPLRLVARKALSSAIGGIVLGESLKSDVNAYIPDGSLAVLANGIPDASGNLRAVKKKNGGTVTVLFLSNLLPTKGPMSFLRMAKKVLEEEKSVRFVMAGPPRSVDFAATLHNFIRANGLEDSLTMPGGVYGEEKDRLFQEADIFVFPTSYLETFGIVNLEAMQWGLPVISSPVGAIPEVVVDGESGYIVDPEDTEAMAQRVLGLVRNPELRMAMGQRGRERFEKEYSIDAFERNVAKVVNFFMELQKKKIIN
jgi:glycosyltransferase involved in cell wall biosynthesis